MCQAVPLSQHGLELFTRKQARTQYQALREQVQTLARAQRIRFFRPTPCGFRQVVQARAQRIRDYQANKLALIQSRNFQFMHLKATDSGYVSPWGTYG